MAAELGLHAPFVSQVEEGERRLNVVEAAADAGGPPGEILALVAWGMDRELREVFDLVRSKPEAIAADEADEDAD